MDVTDCSVDQTPHPVRYPCYMVFQHKDRDWRWVYYGKDRRKIAESAHGYASKRDALHAVFLIKTSGMAPVF